MSIEKKETQEILELIEKFKEEAYKFHHNRDYYSKAHIIEALISFVNKYGKEQHPPILPPPTPPLSRVMIDGVLKECPNCHSSAVRKPFLIGNLYCINPECYLFEHPIFKK